MSDNKFQDAVESLFRGMDGFLTTKTVVGDAVKFDDGTLILPLVEVSFGVAAGAWAKGYGNTKSEKGGSGGGMGGKITPSAVIVMKDGHAKLVNIKNQDMATKIIDMVPDIVDRVTSTVKEKMDLKKKVNSVVDDEKNSAASTQEKPGEDDADNEDPFIFS
jgi:uncharacterized spore protein YtfJ